MRPLLVIVAAFIPVVSAHGQSLSPPPELLSQTGLYSDIAAKTIESAFLEFKPRYELWTDGASKRRWVRLPEDTKIDTTDPDRWVFPDGTVMFKEFAYQQADTLRRVETRLVFKENNMEFVVAAYKWNEEQTDATLVGNNGEENVFPTSETTSHDIPSVANCNRCHRRGGDLFLGFDAVQLNYTPEAADLLNLDKLVSLGKIDQVDANTQLEGEEEYSAGYLHANCGHCHNSMGSAAFTPMRLRHKLAGLADVDSTNWRSTVLGHAASFFRIPGIDPAEQFLIAPGEPDKSAILFRLKQATGFRAMPPVGKEIVHQAAVERIEGFVMTLGEPEPVGID